MAAVKTMVGRFLLGILVLLFVLHYIFGGHGLLYGWRIVQENQLLEEEIIALQREIAALHDEMVAWQREPFFKEKLAREKLQLARQGETIYYRTNE